MKVRRTFRFYPTPPQERQLAKEFGCARHAYNFGLKLRTNCFKAGITIGYHQSSAILTKHRHDPEFSWLLECTHTGQQQALRQLQTAFSNFFQKRTKYPKFRSKHGKQSVEYTTNAFEWDSLNRTLRISKIGHLRIRWSRNITGSPSTVTITKDCAGRYFVSLCLDEPAKIPLPKTGDCVGIDLGLVRLATLSNGEKIANPRHTAKYAAKLAKEQKTLARRVKGSGRYKRQKLKVAKIHAKIADSRKDALDKLTTDLVRRFDIIAIEDLNVRGMVRNHKLAKHISCASFGQFRSMLDYKADWYGKEVRLADRFFPSSKRCFSCGHIHNNLDLSIREFNCENCNERLDRDLNAAKNILKFAAGPAVKARGEGVSPPRTSVRRGCPHRSVNQPALKQYAVKLLYPGISRLLLGKKAKNRLCIQAI